MQKHQDDPAKIRSLSYPIGGHQELILRSGLKSQLRIFEAHKHPIPAKLALYTKGFLRQMDENNPGSDEEELCETRQEAKDISEISFETGTVFDGRVKYQLSFDHDAAELILEKSGGAKSPSNHVKQYSSQEARALKERFAHIHTELWCSRYSCAAMIDGEVWSLSVKYSEGADLQYDGYNAYPANWNELLEFFREEGLDVDG